MTPDEIKELDQFAVPFGGRNALLIALDVYLRSAAGKAITSYRELELGKQKEACLSPCNSQDDCLKMEYAKGVVFGLEIDPARNLLERLKKSVKENENA